MGRWWWWRWWGRARRSKMAAGSGGRERTGRGCRPRCRESRWPPRRSVGLTASVEVGGEGGAIRLTIENSKGRGWHLWKAMTSWVARLKHRFFKIWGTKKKPLSFFLPCCSTVTAKGGGASHAPHPLISTSQYSHKRPGDATLETEAG